MNIRDYVIKLLDTYQERSKQIELLRYELSHPPRVSENEMIGALALSHGDGAGRPTGHASDKTLYIALNYQTQAGLANDAASDEVAKQLVALEQEQERLNYYVSLLNERQRKVAKLFYFEGMTQDQIAVELGVTVRYIQAIKSKAVDELVSMYEYVDGLR